jgi:hypothetical protein
MEGIFSESEVANHWRSVTYESIYASITDEDNQGRPSPLRKAYDLNVTEAIQRIIAIMEQATGSTLSEQKVNKVHKAVSLAAKMGLQFGVHMDKLEFTWPRQQAQVVIGREFIIEREGGRDSGKAVLVDLVVEPGLSRLGDGRGNLERRIALLPCKFVPLSS